MRFVRDFVFYSGVSAGLALAMTAPFDMPTLTLAQTTSLFIGNLALYFIVLAMLERFHDWLKKKLEASDHRS